MIDKNWKLQRYGRKDYSELVDFPVEIVGRDGVTRRYTFEDAIRLYQRRVTFAPIRYRDAELVDAETRHCLERIDQLRRSYFHAHGWGTPYGEPGSEVHFGPLAGELAAFLRRVLRCTSRPELSFQAVSEEADDVGTWYVTPRGSPGMLLYVHRFDGPTADDVREAFFAQLKDLEQVGRTDGDVERLLAFHHTVDCGFILAGRGDELDALESDGYDDSMDLTPTEFDRALDLVRSGRHQRALKGCQALLRDQPWHLRAYRLGCLLALDLEEPWTADELSLVGTRYFPEDGRLLWYRSVALQALDQPELAQESLTKALACEPGLLGARAYAASRMVAEGRVDEAMAFIRSAPTAEEGASRVRAELDRLLGMERQVQWVNRIATASLLGLLVLGALVSPWALALLPAGVLAPAVGAVVWSRALRDFAGRPSVESVGSGVRRLHRGFRPKAFDG